MLQSCETCQKFITMAESSVFSSVVRLSSASESDGSLAEVNSQPATTSAATNVLPHLTDFAKQLEEFLDNVPVSVDNGNLSDHEDVVRDSAIATDNGKSAVCNSDTVTAETFTASMKLLLEWKKCAELLNSCSKSNQQTNGSDSGHDDSNSLPPGVSGDVVNGDTDADVSQQHLSDALGSSDEATVSRLNVNCQKDTNVTEHAKTTLKPTPSVVQPVKTDVAFNAQGNLTPYYCIFYCCTCNCHA